MQVSNLDHSLETLQKIEKSGAHFTMLNIEIGFLFSVKIIWVNLQQPIIFYLISDLQVTSTRAEN